LVVENVVGVIDDAVWISRTAILQSDWAVLAFVVFAHLVHAPFREVEGDGQDKLRNSFKLIEIIVVVVRC